MQRLSSLFGGRPRPHARNRVRHLFSHLVSGAHATAQSRDCRRMRRALPLRDAPRRACGAAARRPIATAQRSLPGFGCPDSAATCDSSATARGVVSTSSSAASIATATTSLVLIAAAASSTTTTFRSGRRRSRSGWTLGRHLAWLAVAKREAACLSAAKAWRRWRGGTLPRARRQRAVRRPRCLRPAAPRMPLHRRLGRPFLPHARAAAVQSQHVGRLDERRFAVRGQLRRGPWALLLRGFGHALPAAAAALLRAVGAYEHEAARRPAGLPRLR